MPDQEANRTEIYHWIVEQTPMRGRVLDIGCGEGDLLARLVSVRQVRGTGIELSEECVSKAVQRGLSVHHGDVEEGLDHYSDGAFDLAVMSLTIQEIVHPRRVLKEVFRVGKRVVVVFPNFAHWSVRWHMAVKGRAPRTASLPHAWYESPNRMFFSVADWEEFCGIEHWRCLNKAYLAGGRRISRWPNLRAEVAMYLMDKQPLPPPMVQAALTGEKMSFKVMKGE